LYETANSRLPPDSSQAFAQAEISSALTGLPLSGVEVLWEMNNLSLGSSFTDEGGIAQLRFTGVEEEGAWLSATVKGGLAGWNVKTIMFSRQLPTLDSLSCDRTLAYPGYEINALAKLKPQAGASIKDVNVHWTFAGQALPDSVADSNGVARITFKVADLGEHNLVASLDYPTGAKTQSVRVETLPGVFLSSIVASPSIIHHGLASKIQVRVVKLLRVAVSDFEVRWTANGEPLPSSYSNSNGWAQVVFQASKAGSVVIEATAESPAGTAKMSTTLIVV
jgi:hypothetical protein